jgi:pyridoxine 5-phosphate synthase
VAQHLRLGVNIDHVATVRNARGGREPDTVRAAQLIARGGGDSITAHLREDRRHITDDDIRRLKAEVPLPLNMEMAATDEMVAIALAVRPHAVCIVPERRAELTTEGGLDVVSARAALVPRIAKLNDANIQVALFIDPDPVQVEATKAVGAPALEFHTGEYCNASELTRAKELKRLEDAAARAAALGVEVHAGHGLTVANVGSVARIPAVVDLNIGHAIVAEAIFVGFEAAIRGMRAAMDRARGSVPAPAKSSVRR